MLTPLFYFSSVLTPNTPLLTLHPRENYNYKAAVLLTKISPLDIHILNQISLWYPSPAKWSIRLFTRFFNLWCTMPSSKRVFITKQLLSWIQLFSEKINDFFLIILQNVYILPWNRESSLKLRFLSLYPFIYWGNCYIFSNHNTMLFSHGCPTNGFSNLCSKSKCPLLGSITNRETKSSNSLHILIPFVVAC